MDYLFSWLSCFKGDKYLTDSIKFTSAMSIQSSYRMYLQKKKYNDILSKIITIQKWWKSKDIYKNKVIKIYAKNKRYKKRNKKSKNNCAKNIKRRR